MTVQVMGGAQVSEKLPEPVMIPDKPVVYIPPEEGEVRAAPRSDVRKRGGCGRVLAVRFFVAAALFAAIYFGKTFGSGEIAALCEKIAVLFG